MRIYILIGGHLESDLPKFIFDKMSISYAFPVNFNHYSNKIAEMVTQSKQYNTIRLLIRLFHEFLRV